MKKIMIISMILNVFFTGCTKTGGAVLSAIVTSGSDTYDADCDGEDIFLDSLFFNEATRSMMPYEDVTSLSFSNGSGDVINFTSEKGEILKHHRIFAETYCTNYHNQRSRGYYVSESSAITFKGILPTGEELEIRGFMSMDRTWNSHDGKTPGNYEKFSMYIQDSQNRDAEIVRIPWMDTANVNREDISYHDFGELKSSVTLAGQEYTDVYVGEDYQTELKVYLQVGIGVIAFKTTEGELFLSLL